MDCINTMRIEFNCKSENEFAARAAVAAFVAQLDPTVEELSEIKTAVSEAVSNCIIHAYPDASGERFWLDCRLYSDKSIKITVRDEGIGIEDISKAKEPLFTTRPEDERSGMGFTVMESFADRTDIISSPGHGTEITLIKVLGRHEID